MYPLNSIMYVDLSPDQWVSFLTSGNQYDVSIDMPDRDGKPKAVSIEKKRFAFEGTIKSEENAGIFGDALVFFDGNRNVFSDKMLDGGLVLTAQFGKHHKVKVSFSAARVFQMDPNHEQVHSQSLIQCLDVMMSSYTAASTDKYIVHNNVVVPRSGGRVERLSPGLEARTAFNQTAIRCESSFLRVVNLCSAVMYQRVPLATIVQGARDVRAALMALNLKGIKVVASNNQRSYTIAGVGLSANDETFEIFEEDDKAREGASRTSSVAQYFAEKYKPLQHPDWPCLRMSRRALVPLELCEFEADQFHRGQVNERDITTIRKIVGLPPNQKLDTIARFNRELISEPLWNTKGFKHHPDPETVEARMLAAPRLSYGNRTITANEGAWDLRGLVVKAPGPPPEKGFVVVKIGGSYWDRGEHGRFMETLSAQAEQMRVDLGKPLTKVCTNFQSVMEMEEKMRTRPVSWILVVIDRKSAQPYNDIKKFTETKFGIPTQCVVAQQVMSAKPQVVANILIKINMKLGGVNWNVDGMIPSSLGTEGKTWCLGYDVEAQPGNTKRERCIGAVVGSTDATLTRFIHRAHAMLPKHDVFDAGVLGSSIEQLGAEYKRLNGTPTSILIYRAGAPSSRFAEIINVEIAAIKTACTRVFGSVPPITCTVVNRRGHLRMFPADQAHARGKGNVFPGTVVDRGIVSGGICNFYMNSHAGIQGTNMPAHYSVLLDENNLSMDELQVLAWNLCHSYQRCTRAVSVPSPLYYATLAANRSAKHAMDEHLEIGDRVVVRDTVSAGMFYC
jgi:hypothetical protein